MATANKHHLNVEDPFIPNKKKKSNQSPETNLLVKLNACSKSKDLKTAIALYEDAMSHNLRLSQHHIQTLLYLCASSVNDLATKNLAVDYGFRIYDSMVSSGISGNEATITAVARLAAAKGDGDYAFKLVKDMVAGGGAPRLRTYTPALLCFCEKLEVDKAYEVEEQMGQAGIGLEEAEIAALLKASTEVGRDEMVYKYLHKLRDSVRCVSEVTGKIIEGWFHSQKGSEVSGGIDYEVDLIRSSMLKNGGGWHGLGWIGEGKWTVRRGSVEPGGRCLCCHEQLACVDIDDAETERFACSVASLAMNREVKANFREFQDWLEEHSDYETIVDGANIGLFQQNFADGGFSVPQLEAVVKELNFRSSKWPLVVLHKKRVRTLLENPSHRTLINEWIDKDLLYATPHGSNDDWYWLYAAVKLKCLLVTNDEMRDHVFELLGRSFFLKWKERHQVRYTFAKGSWKLEMPPQYSVVIQESEKGSWHVPLVSESNEGSSGRSWLCITRSSA